MQTECVSLAESMPSIADATVRHSVEPSCHCAFPSWTMRGGCGLLVCNQIATSAAKRSDVVLAHDDWGFPPTCPMESYVSHFGKYPVHPFPARMAPSIALDHLKAQRRVGVVLDPMAGSGTTLVAARRSGLRAIGFDSDPLAVIVSRISTANVDGAGLQRQAERVLKSARQLAKELTLREAYPIAADEETKAFIRYWYDPYGRVQVAALARAIGEAAKKWRELLWCAFSRLIIAKEKGVSRARDVPHSRPHRAYEQGPIRAFRQFPKAVQFVANNAVFEHDCVAPPAMVKVADARRLPIADATADVVITSPPYLNAIDYVRCTRFTLVWMGHTMAQLRELRARNIGTEVALNAASAPAFVEPIVDALLGTQELPSRQRGMVLRYVCDMDAVVSEICRVLKTDGRAVMVVGNSKLRGTYIENSRLMRKLFSRHGWRSKRTRRRTLPANRRYLPPPNTAAKSAIETRMSEEVVMTFMKR